MNIRIFLFGFFLISSFKISAQPVSNQDFPDEILNYSFKVYLNQLDSFRDEFGGVYKLPDQDFFLFGMGNREKFLYKDGKLFTSPMGKLVFSWDLKEEKIIPNEYSVLLKTKEDHRILIREDKTGIWVTGQGERKKINQLSSEINLPDFKGVRYNEILKVLHQEILINILDSRPLPNYFVYTKPWRRDAAMMAMCLSLTANLHLIKDWVLSLQEPYDFNNGQKQGRPEREADNLGQTLYLLSLFSDRSHPLVEVLKQEAGRLEKTGPGGRYILGRSDFQEVPVYQTKWLKFGLAKMDMEDPYSIPHQPDNYSSLFWWDYQSEHIEGNAWRSDKYPYIGWARDHFYHRKKGLISDRTYPLTWETDASQADYEEMGFIHPEYVERKIATPHTWHASEIFLYLLDQTIKI